MSDRVPANRVVESIAVMCMLLGAGCTSVKMAPPPVEPVPTTVPDATVPDATVEQPLPAPTRAEPEPVATAPVAPASTPRNPVTSPKPAVVPKPVPVPTPAKPPAAVAAATAPAAKPPVAAPRPTAPKPAAAKPAAPPLDLAALELRLRETKAIGVMTKLSLKNQVDDLLDKFRAYYKRQAKTTLAELRRPYDMLLLKVLSLLQDSDPPLARDIVASREAIWGILADPEKFNEAKLMAGEAP
ncbi:MAG: hypothetical protein ABL989_03475 [Gammaproteobacteria bacterium]